MSDSTHVVLDGERGSPRAELAEPLDLREPVIRLIGGQVASTEHFCMLKECYMQNSSKYNVSFDIVGIING
jgi:hypothetical protein